MGGHAKAPPCNLAGKTNGKFQCFRVAPLLAAGLAVGIADTNLALGNEEQAQNSDDSLVFIAPQATCEDPAKQSEWNEAVLKACRMLGENLISGKGPWKLGPFRSVACVLPDSKMGGTEHAADQKANWRLSMALDGAKSLRFTVSFLPRERNQTDAGERPTPEASARMPYTARTLLLLAQSPYARAVAAILLDQLPYVGQVSKKDLKSAPPVKDPTLAPLEFPGRRGGWAYLPVGYNKETDAWTIDEAKGADPENLKIVNMGGRATQQKALTTLLRERFRAVKVDASKAPGDTCGEWQTEKPLAPTPAPTPAQALWTPRPLGEPPPSASPTPLPTPEPSSRSLFGWDAEPYIEVGGGAFGKGGNGTLLSAGALFRSQPLRHAASALLLTAHYARTEGTLGIRIITPPGAAKPLSLQDGGKYVYNEGQVGLSYFTTFPLWGPFGFGAGPGVHVVSQGLTFKDVSSLSFSSDEARDATYGVLSLRGGPVVEWGNVSGRVEGLISTNRHASKEYEDRGVQGQLAYTFAGLPPSARLGLSLRPFDSLRSWAFFFGSHRDILISKDLARTSSSIESARLRLVTTQTLLGAGLGLGW